MANISVSVTDGNNIAVEVTPVPTQVITIDRGIAGPPGPAGPAGSVTSVALSAPSIFNVGGSPITTSGTLALTYSGTALPVANGGTGQTSIPALSVPVANSANTFTSVSPSAGQSVRINAGGTAWEAYTPTAGSGTVTSVSVVSANGLAGTVANATTTPAITLSTSITGVLKGNGTAISAATAGTDYVTPTGSETLTNKTLTNPVFTGYTETVYSTYTTALNAANGTIQRFALTGNTTFTDSLASGQSITLMIDDGTAFTVTWPTINWVGGNAPALATTGYTVIQIWKVSTTLYGALVGTVA